MSRIGKKPIALPQGTNVSVVSGTVTVKGPQGELSRRFPREIAVNVGEGGVRVAPSSAKISNVALWGTYASHMKNMLEGVTKGYVKKLLIEGVGFRWEVSGDTLTLSLGFSHPVKVKVPAGLKASAEKGVLTVSGIDKEKVGQFAAHIRSLRKPEPYKGKGIRYDGEEIRRKQGKKTV